MPPPPGAINPSIAATVSFDKKAGIYTYNYVVRNGSDSPIPIDFFILQLNRTPSSIQSPPKWFGDFMEPVGNMPFQMNWMSVGRKYDIQPGASLSGFSIQSPQPPSPTRYFSEGRIDVPAASPPQKDAIDDEPVPNCPDWDFSNARFKTIVVGLTTGPLDPNITPVAIRLREEKGEKAKGPMDPSKPTGKIGLLVLGSKDFDPSKIVISSVHFGPGQATPLSWKFVPAGHENDGPQDEYEEWERIYKQYKPDFDENPKKQNLLFVFDEAALGVKCVLDRAIFIRGQTQDGKMFSGATSTHLLGCDTKHPGKRAPGRRAPSKLMDGGD